MVWQPEIDEINHRRKLAEQMGGPEGIERQHAQGKLTVRERIAALADPGSFQEVGALVGFATYDDHELVDFRPSNSVMGVCTLDGRKAFVSGGDFTIRGGSSDGGTGKSAYDAEEQALEWRMPYIHLIDSAGASVKGLETLGRSYIPGRDRTVTSRLLTEVPVVAAVMGPAAGRPAVDACLCHFNLIVKDTGQVFPGGPPVVKAALGYDITKEELGGYQVHTQSGVIDNLAENDEEALSIIRSFLSYMPQNVWEMPPRAEPTDDPKRRDEELLSIVPRERNKPYNPYDLLDHVLDRDSLFEIAPSYGPSRITGLARVNGYPVGVMINNPMNRGGALDVAAGDKVIRFLLLCNTFHLPIVCFTDEPGVMVGLESEKQGIERAGARLQCAIYETKVPWITFIVRQLYGVAGGLHLRAKDMHKRYAWPSAHWGSMHVEGGASAAYRREIEAASDPEARREEIERRLQAVTSPFRAAEAFDIEDIIDPRDTRPLLCDFIEAAQDVLRTQLGPSVGPSYRP